MAAVSYRFGYFLTDQSKDDITRDVLDEFLEVSPLPFLYIPTDPHPHPHPHPSLVVDPTQ